MSAGLDPDADRRAVHALATALQAEDFHQVRALTAELALEGRLAAVLFAATVHYVGLLRTIAPRQGVTVEFLIQRAALAGENPPI